MLLISVFLSIGGILVVLQILSFSVFLLFSFLVADIKEPNLVLVEGYCFQVVFLQAGLKY